MAKRSVWSILSTKYSFNGYHEGVLEDFIDLCAAGGCKTLSDSNRSIIFQQVNGKEVAFDELFPLPN